MINATVIHLSDCVHSIHYYEEFSSNSAIKYLITLHTKSFIANHVI